MAPERGKNKLQGIDGCASVPCQVVESVLLSDRESFC